MIDWAIVTPAAAGLLAVVGGSLLSHAVPGGGHLLLLLIAVLLAFTAWRTAFTRPGSTTGPAPEGAAGVGDNREHPTPRSATLPLRGTSHGEEGFSRADPAGGGAADPAGGGAADPAVTGDPAPTAARRVRWRAAGIGVAAGLLSGLSGIGGGVIMVPAFTELLGLSLTSAIATSLVCVGTFGVPATGASLTIRTAEHRLRLAVGVFLALVALVYLVTETRALFEEL